MTSSFSTALSSDVPFAAAEKRVLYYSVLCPFSRQIRFGLGEKKILFTLKEEKIWRPSEDLYTLNPAGTLPVMEEENDGIFVHTYSIIEYLEEAYPDVTFLGSHCAVRAEARRLVDWFNRKFYEEVTVPLLNEKTLKRHLGHGGPDSQVLKEGRLRLQDHLDYIGWLFERRKWLAGDFFSWGDIAAACHLSCLDYLGDVPWNKHRSAKDWYMRIKSRPTFRPFLDEIYAEIKPSFHYRMLDF